MATRAPSDNRRGPPRADRALAAAPVLIGVGVDGDAGGRDALVLGSMIAGVTGGELMLIAVHEETLAECPPQARVVVQPDVLVWRALRQVARREQRDLLVVGSGRTARAGRVKIGAIGHKLLGHLECPLAVAPSGMRVGEPRCLRHIGVGFDGRAEARVALEWAEALGRVAGAELVVCGASAFVGVSCGEPADRLAAPGTRVDLLVIGSGSSGPAGRVFLGKTGRALVDGAQCPVVIVPRPSDAPSL